MFVDYVVYNQTTNGRRAGTFRATHDGAIVRYDETTTLDAGGATTQCRFTSDIPTASNFNFNVTDYPAKFELELLEQHGWYSPSNKGNNLILKAYLAGIQDGLATNNIYDYECNPTLNVSDTVNTSIDLNFTFQTA